MLLSKFREYISTKDLFKPNDRLLLAVSGGLDSAVLCELSYQAGYHFVIAHCNFQLRGEDSERDEQFVKSLGQKYGVEVVVKKFATSQVAGAQKESVETTARNLRYEWFHELVETSAKQQQQPAISHILTAHHADDNIETAVMNFFRGTGIAGVRGMLPKQGKITRPLLFARRAELETFVADNQLPFVSDATNFENDYTRNFFRNEILPLVKKNFPEAERNVLSNIQRFGETEIIYRQSIAEQKKKLLEPKGNEIHIPVLKLIKTAALQTVLYEILKDVGFSAHQSAEAITLLKGETGKYIQSATHRVIKNRHWLIITPNQTTEAQNILIEEADCSIHFETGILKLEKLQTSNIKQQTSNTIAQLDAATIHFPLLLRKWKKGDYFYPLGMQKKKKLSRFFNDQKLSIPQKENTWVVEMDKKIIWVVGMRIDDRFKITGSTKEILQLKLD